MDIMQGKAQSDSPERPDLSILLPARNEARGLEELLPRLIREFPGAEILVVNDGSTDETREICRKHGIEPVSHPCPLGNGAAVKSGVRRVRAPILVLMDADGQHDPEGIPFLLACLEEGYEMAVAARDYRSHAGAARWLANGFYNRLAGWLVGHRIVDLTSGFRAVRTARFRRFLYLLPNGFSYPATITMAFFRSGYPVGYVPLAMHRRIGKSHIHPLRDGLRFLLIILRIGTLYSPLKLLSPLSLTFLLAGCGCGAYALLAGEYFTSTGWWLLTGGLLASGLLVFLFALISEQVTALLYRQGEDHDGDRDS